MFSGLTGGAAGWVHNKFWPLCWWISLPIRVQRTLNHFRRPFATNDHMVQNPPCWRASSLLFPHWDIKQRDLNQSSLTCLCWEFFIGEFIMKIRVNILFKGVARGGGGGVLGSPWRPLCKPFFMQTTYNIQVAKMWVPSIWHSVTPPLKNPGYAHVVHNISKRLNPAFSLFSCYCICIICHYLEHVLKMSESANEISPNIHSVWMMWE